MPNRYHSKQAHPMPSSGASNKAPGSSPKVTGGTQKDRSGSTPKKGWFSKFHVRSEGI